MQAEIGNVTINGGWLVFASLVVVWVALIVEGQTRRLTALLKAAQREAAGAKAKLELAESESGANPRTGLGQLAAAVEQQECEAGRARDPAPEVREG